MKLWFLMLEFRRFNPARCQFPCPCTAPLPTLRWSDLTLGRADTTPAALLDGVGVWHFSRGRYALAAAYRSAGVGPEGALLAPAYHCRTMLDPALALAGAIHLYALNGDLTPRIDSIKAAVASSWPAIRALVVPHYFGFEQPDAVMRELASFCRQHGITLIEDCSHSWQTAIQRAPVCQAATGHIAVASPYKFFPCADGGTLWGNPAQISVAKQSHPRMLNEAKEIKVTLGQGIVRTKSLSCYPAAITAQLAAERGEEMAEFSDQPSGLYSRELEGKSSLALSRWIMGRTRLSTAVNRRRLNYQEWTKAVVGLQGGNALFPDLPSSCAPYMFPLCISAPDPQFFLLKQAGVPIWRWDEMAISNCRVASKYRLHLLHLPCHQSLTAEQMRWMTRKVAEVLK